jgi:hypothetical protein
MAPPLNASRAVIVPNIASSLGARLMLRTQAPAVRIGAPARAWEHGEGNDV